MDFKGRRAPAPAMLEAAEHTSACSSCLELVGKVAGDAPGQSGGRNETLRFDLGADAWLRYEHLEYEQKQAYADGSADAEERAVVDAHLSLCDDCRIDLVNYLADRLEIEPQLLIRYKPAYPVDRFALPGSSRSFWQVGGLWRPLSVAAMLLLTGGFIAWLGASLIGDRTLEPRVANSPPQSAASSSTGDQRPDSAASVSGRESSGNPSRSTSLQKLQMTLRDHGGPVVLESRVRGLKGASEDELETIAAALVEEEIPMPDVVAELRGREGALRGHFRRAAFALLGPPREVVRDSRPVFTWEAVRNASAYQVFVADSLHRTVAISGRLPGHLTSWRPATALARGESYSWIVSANVHGEELLSPSLNDPEWKFKVLSEPEAIQIERFEGRTKSHLARGVVYAQHGLLTESENELKSLLEENQGSSAVRKLLERVQSSRK